MKNFMYKGPERQAEIEYLLKKKKQKIARQQAVFVALFLLLLAGLIYYISYKQYYVEFPGKVHVNVHEVKVMDDMIIFDMNKELGDVVAPGDTVFSYMYLTYLLEQENVNREIDVLTDYRKSKLALEDALNEVAVLETRAAELEKSISETDRHICLGLSTHAEKSALERQLHETEAALQARRNSVRMLNGQLEELAKAVEKSGVNNNTTQIQNLTKLKKKDFDKGVLRYYQYMDSGVVTKLSVARRTMVFRQEEVMHIQPLDADASNIYVSAYVPFDKVKYCTRGTPVEVIINNDIVLDGYVAVQGACAIELPQNLQSNFSSKDRVNQTIFRLKKGQQVPFWCLSEGTPVTVRIRKIDINDKDDTRVYIKT